MTDALLYIGPGLGIGTIVVVLIILLIILAALGIILWLPIKRFFRKLSGKN